MVDITLFELHLHDSLNFEPTTAFGSDALASLTGDPVDEAETESEVDPDDESGGVGRALLTAVLFAVVSTVAAVAVARLLSDDDLSELSELDRQETPENGGSRRRVR